MSSSKIIRYVSDGPAVFIGEKQFDAIAELAAERTMKKIFPTVSLVTTPEGSKLVPAAEVYKMDKKLRDDCDRNRKEGYEQGYKAGLDKGLSEARAVLTNFNKAIEDAIRQREQMLEQAKQKILELVIKISRKVTFQTFQIDQDATVAMIENVIAQLVDRSRLKIKVHPDHLAIVEQNINRFLSGSTTIKELTFEADPRVRIGGCFIETPTGDIDARLSSQFDVVEEALLKGTEEQ